MTDITDEQRAAVEWLQRAADPAVWERSRPFLTADRARVILDALPPELRDPQPVLPTEPGTVLREDETGNVWCRKLTHWVSVDGGNAEPEAPFTRLVPELPQITREQIEEACLAEGTDRPNFRQGLAILALVNGADRD